MGRASQRRHSMGIILSEDHQIVCRTRKASIAGGFFFFYFRMSSEGRHMSSYVIECVRACVCAYTFYLAVHEQPEGECDVHAPVSEVLLTVHSGCGVRRRESHERSSRDIGVVQSDELCLSFFSFLSKFCSTHTHTHKTGKHIILSVFTFLMSA